MIKITIILEDNDKDNNDIVSMSSNIPEGDICKLAPVLCEKLLRNLNKVRWQRAISPPNEGRATKNKNI